MSSPEAGSGSSADAAKGGLSTGNKCGRSPTPGSPDPASFIPGPTNALPLLTQGGSRMRASRTYGSVRGALSNERPYRDPDFVGLFRPTKPYGALRPSAIR